MSWCNCSGSRTTFRSSKVELKCASSEHFLLLVFDQILTATMNVCRWTPTSCAQIRGWTQSWLISWCCSWTESTHRYLMTKKLTGSLLFISDTVVIKKSPNHWAEVVPAAMFVLVVQEPECSHQSASGRAAETPLWEGRGGVWRVLQRASPSSRGCLHRPANKGLAKRLKIGPENFLNHWSGWKQSSQTTFGSDESMLL